MNIVTDLNYLRQESQILQDEDINRYKLVCKFKMAMSKAWINGYGLAGIQIRYPYRTAWYCVGRVMRLLINPRIIETGKKFIHEREGCLSIPNKYFDVERFRTITIENNMTDILELDGIEALVVQHEIDHMDGILICDKGRII